MEGFKNHLIEKIKESRDESITDFQKEILDVMEDFVQTEYLNWINEETLAMEKELL